VHRSAPCSGGVPVIRAIPLWQPWATLVAIGAKKLETRHYPAPRSLIGQRLAIHATLTNAWLHLADDVEPFNRRLREGLGLASDERPSQHLPLGGIVATAVLDSTRGITTRFANRLDAEDPDECAFGNYAVGRYAWMLRDVIRVDPMVPMKGQQGAGWPVPEGVDAVLREQGYIPSA
jgi:hypothetical protein